MSVILRVFQYRIALEYMRISKSDGRQTLALQRDALTAAGVEPTRLYEDMASGRQDDRPGLMACLKSLQPGNTLVIMTTATLKMAMAALADPNNNATEVARRLGLTRTTLYTYLNGDGSVKAVGQRLLEAEQGNGPLKTRQTA